MTARIWQRTEKRWTDKLWTQTLWIGIICTVFFHVCAAKESVFAQTKPLDEKPKLYKAAAGDFSVEVVDRIELNDESRDRPLQIRVSFPRSNSESKNNSANKWPVIVYSHGAGGSKAAYEPLVQHWVSHGYVCIQPTHGDSISLMTREEKRKYRSLRDYVNAGTLAKHQLDRPNEIKLILDNLELIEKEISELAGRLDKERIGMGGHSFGAHTTAMIGGLSLYNGRRKDRTTNSDERPKALLMISPQGLGGQLDKDSWKEIKRPSMVVTGTNDKGRKGQSHEWRLQAFDRLAADTKYLTFLEDADHGFGGISGTRFNRRNSTNAAQVQQVCSATLAFWDAWLQENEKALNFLKSDQMAKATDGKAKIRAKK